MGTMENLMNSIRKVILMESKIDELSVGVRDTSRILMDHERRLVRIETMIEMSDKSSSQMPLPKK